MEKFNLILILNNCLTWTTEQVNCRKVTCLWAQQHNSAEIEPAIPKFVSWSLHQNTKQVMLLSFIATRNMASWQDQSNINFVSNLSFTKTVIFNTAVAIDTSCSNSPVADSQHSAILIFCIVWFPLQPYFIIVLYNSRITHPTPSLICTYPQSNPIIVIFRQEMKHQKSAKFRFKQCF